MSNEPKSQHVFVNDGDTLIVVARNQGPTVSDPCDVYPFASQAYRVVADRFGPTLALVPLNAKPRKTTQSEVDQFLQRRHNELEKEILNLVNDPASPSRRSWKSRDGSLTLR